MSWLSQVFWIQNALVASISQGGDDGAELDSSLAKRHLPPGGPSLRMVSKLAEVNLAGKLFDQRRHIPTGDIHAGT